ncbi:B box and SPRY domain-containing protein isoform X4 [Anser cygnoides]|uniref:B box and SPRY domain-containing protein isoform X4 n=1 Tax=Anser cygnoides TaxID=8845 RepID=UPI0034D3830C
MTRAWCVQKKRSSRGQGQSTEMPTCPLVFASHAALHQKHWTPGCAMALQRHRQMPWHLLTGDLQLLSKQHGAPSEMEQAGPWPGGRSTSPAASARASAFARKHEFMWCWKPQEPSRSLTSLIRTEVAEGILEPQESVKLNFNQQCVQSPLLHRLWASAVLSCITGSQEIHIDEKTVSPHLSLSEDKKTLTFSPKKAKLDLDCPDRFDHWPNALATAAFQTGLHAWKISVEKSCAYKLGVCYGSLPRKGSGNEVRLGFNAASWVFSRYDKEFRFLHAGQPQPVELIKSPAEIGVLVDFAGGEVLFYDPDSCAILFSHRETFAAPLYPVFAVAHHSISLVQ